ncbi:MAG TPA: NAD(P)-binding domain-containing protein, partial [Caldimonas sp.]|nr:NAD(P)-binding domain-containing protein [Caldimonas sp.]
GTGSFGRALAVRVVTGGEDEVVIGSRDASRAAATAAEIGHGATGTTNDDAVRGADLVVLAVKADGALETASAISTALGTTPILSVASAIQVRKGVGALPDPDAVSLAERIQELVAAPVCAGLHSIAAASLGASRPDEDALVCGDNAASKEVALSLAARVVAGRALDAGPLEVARALEGLTAVIVNLNRRYRTQAGVRITGIG